MVKLVDICTTTVKAFRLGLAAAFVSAFAIVPAVADDGSGSSIFGVQQQAAFTRTAAAVTGDEDLQKLADELDEIAYDSSNVPPVQKCPTTAQYKARYHAGCWACLVIEKLTSSFLWAADKGLGITQKAGLIVLWVGVGLWLAFWALKNVSSFTQLQLGNILNDLFKFFFKVAVAYWFIMYSTSAISKYFITPIMGVGASIGQQFWDSKTQEYTEDFVWEDEYVSKEDQQNIDDALSTTNHPGGGADDQAPAKVVPEVVDPDDDEETVQQFQKAFVAVLQKYLKEIQNSCKEPKYMGDNPKCKQSGVNECRHYGKCPDKGHRAYVRGLFEKAGSGLGEGAYCIVSITAALEEVNRQVGGNVANFQTGKVSCSDAIKTVGSKYQNVAIVGENGGDVDLNQAIRYANVGDIVYIRVSGRVAGETGSGSGYHATTYMGGGKLISFNGDGIYNGPSAFSRRPVGKIIRMSEVIRQRLKTDSKPKIDKNALNRLASESGVARTLVNYKGGQYKDFAPGGADELIVEIPDEIPYTGPTNIMPKSVMNSILGAIRAITYETANVMVLGNIITCYATDGGAWKIEAFNINIMTVPNFFMWIEGAIVWCMGFMLVLALGYYFIDISFKIGFAVLAFPIVMGLWPFNMTQGKLFVIVSVIAKSAALFAFLAIVTNFGMLLLGESLTVGGLDELYAKIDTLAQGADEDTEDLFREEINNTFSLFSTTFLMLMFSLIYFFKLVQQTSSDLVNKFFPDKTFGDSSPMHSAATMMTAWSKKMAMKVSGADLAKDIVANQAGVLVKKGLHKTGQGIAYPFKAAGRAIKKSITGNESGKNGGGK